MPRKALGPHTEVDWTDIRVICLAPTYKKYDLFAAQVMASNLELWTYRFFKNGTLFLEEVLQRALTPSPLSASSESQAPGKNPVMVEAGKKAALTRASGAYTFDQHLEGKPSHVRELALQVREVMNSLAGVEEDPKKLYVAYKSTKNIVCMEVQQQKVYLYLKLDPKKFKGPEGISRDVTAIGHFGTGDLEVTLKSLQDLEAARPFLKKAYEAVGG